MKSTDDRVTLLVRSYCSSKCLASYKKSPQPRHSYGVRIGAFLGGTRHSDNLEQLEAFFVSCDLQRSLWFPWSMTLVANALSSDGVMFASSIFLTILPNQHIAEHINCLATAYVTLIAFLLRRSTLHVYIMFRTDYATRDRLTSSGAITV